MGLIQSRLASGTSPRNSRTSNCKRSKELQSVNMLWSLIIMSLPCVVNSHQGSLPQNILGYLVAVNKSLNYQRKSTNSTKKLTDYHQGINIELSSQQCNFINNIVLVIPRVPQKRAKSKPNFLPFASDAKLTKKEPKNEPISRTN